MKTQREVHLSIHRHASLTSKSMESKHRTTCEAPYRPPLSYDKNYERLDPAWQAKARHSHRNEYNQCWWNISKSIFQNANNGLYISIQSQIIFSFHFTFWALKSWNWISLNLVLSSVIYVATSIPEMNNFWVLTNNFYHEV